MARYPSSADPVERRQAEAIPQAYVLIDGWRKAIVGAPFVRIIAEMFVLAFEMCSGAAAAIQTRSLFSSTEDHTSNRPSAERPNKVLWQTQHMPASQKKHT